MKDQRPWRSPPSTDSSRKACAWSRLSLRKAETGVSVSASTSTLSVTARPGRYWRSNPIGSGQTSCSAPPKPHHAALGAAQVVAVGVVAHDSKDVGLDGPCQPDAARGRSADATPSLFRRAGAMPSPRARVMGKDRSARDEWRTARARAIDGARSAPGERANRECECDRQSAVRRRRVCGPHATTEMGRARSARVRQSAVRTRRVLAPHATKAPTTRGDPHLPSRAIEEGRSVRMRRAPPHPVDCYLASSFGSSLRIAELMQ